LSDPAKIQLRALRDILRWLGGASAGASAWEGSGVTAAVVPAARRRSIVNSAVFDSAGALEAAYDGLVTAYSSAGIEAWSVWTPEHDADAIAFLKGRGHAFDGEPLAMTLDLAGFDQPDLGDLEWDSNLSFAELGRVNDVAYGHEEGEGLAGALAGPAADVPMRLHRAVRDEQTASVLATVDHEDDLGIYWVATAPGHERQGLAGRLLAAALTEARQRGMRTSSLQSSAKGQAVYARLGYEAHFRLHLYERRG
jgi:GNAT superfamily N-acetyltransferase